MAISKEQGVSISVATVVSVLPLLAAFWFVGKPFIADAVAAELSEDFDKKIEAQAAPIKGAFTVLLLRDIADLRRAIAAQEFIRDNPPEDDWSASDVQDLVNMRLELESLQNALAALTRPVVVTE